MGHVALEKNDCPTLCKKYKHEVPRPTVYNWCIIGCHAAAHGQKRCKRQCKYSDLPRPTTTRACEHGCNQYHYEQKVCTPQKAKPIEVEKPTPTPPAVDVSAEGRKLNDETASKPEEKVVSEPVATNNDASAKTDEASTKEADTAAKAQEES